MALKELRTYSPCLGKLAEVERIGARAGPRKLVGYFIGDVGALNQIVHLWKFVDDADRRRFWEAGFADEAFMAFARKLRPLVRTQQNKLLLAAPWGPHP